MMIFIHRDEEFISCKKFSKAETCRYCYIIVKIIETTEWTQIFTLTGSD